MDLLSLEISTVIESIDTRPMILKVFFLKYTCPLLLNTLEIPSAYPMPKTATLTFLFVL